jgi:serine/threonine-protein kinase
MAIDTIDRFLAVIRRLRLLAPEQLDQVATDLGPHYDEPLPLAQFLVQSEWLTDYQCDALFDGRWDELTLGPYQILARLGEGGVSDVFKAWDTDKGRIVALKVLRQGLGSQSDALRQFKRELEAVTLLNHPNVIKTFDADQLGTMHYFAMEYVEGIDLQRFVAKRGRLPVEMACDYVRQVALGLQHAHQHGLVHRDIKPANLLLVNGMPPLAIGTARRPDPQIKILDWGLARVMHGPGESNGSTGDLEKGLLIGTADYIAPEQASDPGLVDTRADLYSLGCTFYFLLTGQPPFPGTSLMQKLLQHREAQPPEIRQVRPDVPLEVEHILGRLLAKAPESRIQIPLLLVAALRGLCPGAGYTGTSVVRPPSSSNLSRDASNDTALPGQRLPRPPGARPSTLTNLNRPSTSTVLPPRPGTGH